MRKSNLNKHRWYEYYIEVHPVKITNYYDITPKIFFKEKVLFKALNNCLDSKKTRFSIN